MPFGDSSREVHPFIVEDTPERQETFGEYMRRMGESIATAGSGDWVMPEHLVVNGDERPHKPRKKVKKMTKREMKEKIIKSMDSKMRYGCEMEFEAYDPVYWDDIQKYLNDKGYDNVEIKGDGSLSEHGFEVLSPVMDSIEDLEEFMIGVMGALTNEYSLGDDSPCAIHIHVSNTKNPINLFSLGTYYASVFEHIRKGFKSNLVHRYSMWPHKDYVKEVLKLDFEDIYKRFGQSGINMMEEQQIDMNYALIAGAICDPFMGSRRCTIRYTGWDTPNRTMEFRIFPQKFDKELYKLYLRIVKVLVEESDKYDDGFLFDKLSNLSDGFLQKYNNFNNLMEFNEEDTELLYNGQKIYTEEEFNEIHSINPTNSPRILDYDLLPETVRDQFENTNLDRGHYIYIHCEDIIDDWSFIILQSTNTERIVYKIRGAGDYYMVQERQRGTPTIIECQMTKPSHPNYHIPWVILDGVERDGHFHVLNGPTWAAMSRTIRGLTAHRHCVDSYYILNEGLGELL